MKDKVSILMAGIVFLLAFYPAIFFARAVIMLLQGNYEPLMYPVSGASWNILGIFIAALLAAAIVAINGELLGRRNTALAARVGVLEPERDVLAARVGELDEAKLQSDRERDDLAAQVRALRLQLKAGLTARQSEVLSVLLGYNRANEAVTNAQIAEALRIGIGAVERHLTDIYTKLGVPDRTTAVKVAIEMLSTIEVTSQELRLLGIAAQGMAQADIDTVRQLAFIFSKLGMTDITKFNNIAKLIF